MRGWRRKRTKKAKAKATAKKWEMWDLFAGEPSVDKGPFRVGIVDENCENNMWIRIGLRTVRQFIIAYCGACKDFDYGGGCNDFEHNYCMVSMVMVEGSRPIWSSRRMVTALLPRPFRS
jgi:hypothetical protein